MTRSNADMRISVIISPAIIDRMRIASPEWTLSPWSRAGFTTMRRYSRIGHRDQHEDREAFLRQDEEPVRPARQPVPERERREHTGREDLDAADGEDDESPEDQRVQRTGDGIAQDLSLRDAYREEVPGPPPDVVPARLVLPDAQKAIQPLRAEREARDGSYQDEKEEDVGRRHGFKLRRAIRPQRSDSETFNTEITGNTEDTEHCRGGAMTTPRALRGPRALRVEVF